MAKKKSNVPSPKSKVGKGKAAGTPGPKPSITIHVVKRVAERYGMGVPLKEALAAEENPTINLETWKKALAAHPELSPPYEAAQGKFLEWAMRKLAKARKLNFLCFLLQCRRPDLFAKPAAVAVSVSNTNNIVGLPDDVLERARQIARQEAKGGK